MSTDDEYEALRKNAAALRPMTRWEKRAQAISFSAYNVILDRPGCDEWRYLALAAKAHDDRAGQWRDGTWCKKRLSSPKKFKRWEEIRDAKGKK